MDLNLLEKLRGRNLIPDAEYETIKLQKQQPVSLYWDLHSLLYLGIILFTTGMGILVYKNIDTIGHQAIIVLIAVLCAACFWYCFKKSNGYLNKKIEAPTPLFDYILLLGCMLLLTFIGYIQFQYNVFGNQWGLAVFIPMILLFSAAYYFDHLGVLSIAITNLAAWAGITVTPLQILRSNNFGDANIIYTAMALGAGLIGLSYFSVFKHIKTHFAFTYKNFGAHILFIALFAAMFNYDHIYFLWFIVIMAVSTFMFLNALKENSFYFLVITVLYAYIAVSSVVLKLFFYMDDVAAFYLAIIWFIGSGIGLIKLLIHYSKIMKQHASL